MKKRRALMSPRLRRWGFRSSDTRICTISRKKIYSSKSKQACHHTYKKSLNWRYSTYTKRKQLPWTNCQQKNLNCLFEVVTISLRDIPLFLEGILYVHYLRMLGRCRKFPSQDFWRLSCDKNRLKNGDTILIQCANLAYWLQARAGCARAQVSHEKIY